MELKKEMGVLMLLSAVLLAGCSSDKSVTQEVSESTSNPVTTQPEQETNAKLIEASENGKVKLYAIKEAKYGIEGVTLDINGKQKDFDWDVPDTGTKPQVFYTDLTGDGKEEALIIIQTGRGTGLNLYDMHVIHAEDLSEIKVPYYEDIVADQIETHVAKHVDGTLAITVKTNEQEYNFNHSNVDLGPNYSQDKLAFGGVVIHALENQKIITRLGASVGISPQYVCDLVITYKFDHAKNEFIADQIAVETYDR